MKRYVSSDELKDLPKYASCGLIRFKMTMFRETTYRYQFFFFNTSKLLLCQERCIKKF